MALRPRERALLVAYVAADCNLKAAAREVGVTPSRARQILSAMYRREGVAGMSGALVTFHHVIVARATVQADTA